MTRRGREFVGNRLRRSPPDRANAVSCGQGAENAARFPHLAHRPAVAHKPHGTAAATGRIDSAFDSGDHQNRQPGTGFSLSPPGTCPNTRNRRIAQDLRLNLRWRHHHASAPSSPLPHGRDDAGAAETPDGAATDNGGRTIGSTDRAAGAHLPEGKHHRQLASLRPAPADHAPPARGNRDASLFLARRGSGPFGRHARGGRAGSPGNADPPPEPSCAGRVCRSRHCSRPARDRSSCR